MQLQRLFTHRLIRALRLILPLVVIALVAIPTWNYFARKAEKADQSKLGRQLPAGVSVHTEGFTFSQTEGGRTSYTVRAKTYLGAKDNKSMLEDVDVTVYGTAEKDPNRTIHGKHCTYDDDTKDFECNGSVEVRLDEKTIVRSEQMIYNHRDGIVTSPQRAFLEQEGTTGQANHLEYGINSGLLKLNGDVKVDTADHTHLETASAVFQQKENWATMSGGAFIKSANGWVRGSTGRADLEPNTYKPKTVTIDGDVTGESQPQLAHDSWKIRAAWLETAISLAGYAERVKARGNVEIEKAAGDTHQRLSGGEVDTTLNAGKVEVVEARQNARMLLASDQTLESNLIRTNGTGSVQTTGNSTLTVGDSTIQGRDFVIENGEDIVAFDTTRRATLKKAGDQESSADRTSARFDSRTSMLQELVQTGNFQFRTPQYQGRAQSGRFEEGGTVVTLDGSPVVNDSEKRLEAAQIRLNEKDNSFIATKNVSTLMKNTDEQVLVKAARAEGGGDSMLYSGNVQLWRSDAYIKADRLNASGGQENSKIHAEAAAGARVQSNLQNMRATSDTLDYDSVSGVGHYKGHVRAQKQDMIVETPDMIVNFRDKSVTEIVASGGVKVTRADQVGTGERAVYEATTDVVTLTGKNAQVRDREHGLVQGPTLTMKNKGQSVSVESGNGERTVTQHPMKNVNK